MGELLSEIEVPDIGSAQLALKDIQAKREQDIFAEQKRKGWDKTVEARCDFTPRPRLTRRSGLFFLSYWQKSVYGRTLTEIKADNILFIWNLLNIEDGPYSLFCPTGTNILVKRDVQEVGNLLGDASGKVLHQVTTLRRGNDAPGAA